VRDTPILPLDNSPPSTRHILHARELRSQARISLFWHLTRLLPLELLPQPSAFRRPSAAANRPLFFAPSLGYLTEVFRLCEIYLRFDRILCELFSFVLGASAQAADVRLPFILPSLGSNSAEPTTYFERQPRPRRGYPGPYRSIDGAHSVLATLGRPILLNSSLSFILPRT